MECAFLGVGIEACILELLWHILDMVLMLIQGVGANEDVIQVPYHTDIQEVSQDIIDESLKHCWSIGKIDQRA